MRRSSAQYVAWSLSLRRRSSRCPASTSTMGSASPSGSRTVRQGLMQHLCWHPPVLHAWTALSRMKHSLCMHAACALAATVQSPCQVTEASIEASLLYPCLRHVMGMCSTRKAQT